MKSIKELYRIGTGPSSSHTMVHSHQAVHTEQEAVVTNNSAPDSAQT